VLLLLLGAWLLFFRSGDKAAEVNYTTEPAAIGMLVVKVSATGNLQPTNQVDVGSELSGIVDQVFVDDNDSVKKGQALARLDLSKLQDAVAKSRASLAAAEAQLLQAQATVAETRASLARFREVARLSGGKVPSKTEMDTAEANLKRAEANEASARASITQARANLKSDETNLTKATIRSPIDGVVLARKVEPGQTVAASFQAPVLFTLAEDLAKMELQVDVDEADVGQVKLGQKAVFSVDAWPGRLYSAVITRVGYGSQVKDGVVSYLSVLEVGNDDLSLRPGMTGTAEITTLTRDQALLVPNAALRFTPETADTQQKSSRSVMSFLMPSRTRPTPKSQPVKRGAARVWVLRDGQPVPLDVQAGASNGRVTEITGGELKAGMPVITETVSAPQ
jgi:HlyD family secretion protein